MLVEIDLAAERIVDARSARRLVPLELADVAVPRASGSRGATVLFFRVLGRRDGTLRIELWERGEYHGQRALSGAGENPQLVARRVALAAAELGRRLSRKRGAQLAREARLRQQARLLEQQRRERTQDGPVALRSELSAVTVSDQLRLVGPRLTGELSVSGPLRLDLGAEWLGGWLAAGSEPELLASLEGVGVGPSYRWVLGRSWDIDVGGRLSALLLQVPRATALDGNAEQESSWSARADVSARLELRLSRQLRVLLGGEFGGLLRSVAYSRPHQEAFRLRGGWWGGTLGVVVTPP